MFNLNENYPYEPDINDVVLRLVDAHCVKNKSYNFLDVGCGFGFLSLRLKNSYKTSQFYGIENSQIAKKAASMNLHLFFSEYENCT